MTKESAARTHFLRLVASPTQNDRSLEYTNRCGVTFYLHQGRTKTGKPKYFVAKTVGAGALVRMPVGFEFAESVNGVVSVRRVLGSPKLVPDADVEVVRDELKRHRHLRHYRAGADKRHLVIYEPAHRLSDLELAERARTVGVAAEVLEEQMADLWERGRFEPVMRFVPASSPGQYAIQRMTYRGAGGWSYSLAHGALADLAARHVPLIGTERFFDLV